jgi:hypothetical protein
MSAPETGSICGFEPATSAELGRHREVRTLTGTSEELFKIDTDVSGVRRHLRGGDPE